MKNKTKKCLMLINMILLLIFTLSNISVKVDAYDEALKSNMKKLLVDTIDNSKKRVDIRDPEEEIRVIIQLDNKSTIEQYGKDYTNEVKEKEEDIKRSHADIIEKAESITGTKVIKDFGYLLNGFSINTKRKYVAKLQQLDGIKYVKEVNTYTPDMYSATEITKAETVWKDIGYRGEGMVISIIDTGVDYKHKDLKNINVDKTKLKESFINSKIDELGYGKYFTDKIPYGYNYADENTEIIDTGNMHGMSVAGIAAANGSEDEVNNYKAIKGIAPEAQILAMKVFTNNGKTSSAYEDDIISAIEDSVKLGADVINMSFSLSAGFSEIDDAESKAVQRAIDAGVVCIGSAGNNGISSESSSFLNPTNSLGIKDYGLVGFPSTVPQAISVASMEDDLITYRTLNMESDTGENIDMTYYTPLSKKDYSNEIQGEFEVVDCGKADLEELRFKNLAGKIALVEGTNNVQEQYENLIKYNVKGMIIYNDLNSVIPVVMYLNSTDRPVIGLTNSQGKSLKEMLANGGNIINFSFKGMPVNNPLKGKMSTMSSWGTTSDLEFKPEVTAPGGEIYSLANNNSYVMSSGTSMSAPQVAGAETLILQKLKEENTDLSKGNLVVYAKNRLMNTAKPILDENSVPYSPRRQGAGVIDIEKALKNNVIIKYKDNKAAAALKEVGNYTDFELTLTNYGEKDITYTLKDENVYGEETDGNGLIHEVLLKGSLIKCDRNSITVAAGESVVVKFSLNVSQDEEKDRYVEGYLNFNSSDNESPSLSIPFMGFYGDWNKENIIDTPNYEGSDSLLGATGLVFNNNDYCGSYIKDGEEYIDKEKAAFSPDGDGIKDDVMPALYMLRNAKELKIEILDSRGNVIRDIYNGRNIRKNMLSDRSPSYINEAVWDGRIYDLHTGKFVTAEDGKYTVRVKSKLDIEGAREQILDLPIKIDTRAPKVSIIGVEKYVGKEDGNNHFKLLWKAEDEEGGSGISDNCVVSVNGVLSTIEADSIEENEDIYKAEIAFNDGEINDISIGVSDNAGNITIAESREKADSLKMISLSSLSDGMVIGEKDLVDGKFIIKGTAGDELGRIKINENDIEISDNYFSTSIDMKDGENVIKVKAEDKKGNEVLNSSYKVTLDRKDPEVKVSPDVGNTQPYYLTEDKKMQFDIEVHDDSLCTASLKNISESNISTPVILDLEKKGTGVVNLVNGLNNIELVVKDAAGNEKIENYLVMKGSSTAKLQVAVDNLSAIQYLNKNDTNNGVYTIKGHTNKKISMLKINDRQVKVKDDLTFVYDAVLKEGKNMIKVYAEDVDKTVSADYSYKIYYDEKAPSVVFENMPIIRDDNKIYVNSEDFILEGKLKENLFGYTLYVNGENILEENDNLHRDEIEKNFKKVIKLQDGDNKIKINAVDSNINEMNEELDVVLDKEASLKPKIKLSNEKVSNNDVVVELSSSERELDRIEYSVDGINYIKYTGKFTLGSSVTLYARTVDFAGNISDVQKAEVNIDRIKPNIILEGAENNKIYYEPVKLTAKTDDKNAKVVILVNGEEYNGEIIDTAGDYTVLAYSEDEAVNKSDSVMLTFKIANKYANTESEIKGPKNNFIDIITENKENLVKSANDESYKNNTNLCKTKDNNIVSLVIMLMAFSGVISLAVSRYGKNLN